MSETTTETPAPTKAPKPPVFDGRPEDKQVAIELGMRVKLLGDQDKDGEGKPKLGTVTGIEYQRQRVVVKVDGQEKLIVRPASKVHVLKNKSGKIERVERAVRAGRKAQEETASETTAATEDAPSPV